MKNVLFLSALLLLSFPVLAQQTWTNGYFPFNRFLYNPAFTALNEKMQVDALFGGYLGGLSGYNKDYQLNAQYKLPNIGSGLGINAFQELIGDGNLQQFNLNIAYSYRHIIGKSHKYRMSYGINTGYYGLNINAYFNPNIIKFNNTGLGASFSAVDDKFYMGMSAPIVISIPHKNNSAYRLARIYHLNAGYRFDIGQWSIQPNLLFNIDKYDIYTTLATQIKHKWLNIGLGGSHSYSYETSLVFLSLQATIKKRWTIGYIYQKPLYGNSTRQMIMLSYRRK